MCSCPTRLTRWLLVAVLLGSVSCQSDRVTSPSGTAPDFATAAATYTYAMLRAGSNNSCLDRAPFGTNSFSTFCWGNNNDGAVGIGTTGGSILRPRAISNPSGGSPWLADIGLRHQCSLFNTTGGMKAYCWGYNANGRLGDGTTTSRNVPTLVRGGITNWSQISTGHHHTCAVTQLGVAYCWGDGSFGALGNGSTLGSLTPIGVHTNIAFQAVYAGEYFTCGRAKGSSPAAIYCWGQNSFGQLGIGNTTHQMTPGPAVIGGAKWIETMTVGGHHVCAISYSPSQLHCWGDNTYGQLGIGNTTRQTSPVVVNTFFQPISAGNDFTCGRHGSGNIYCWGRGDLGSLGNGFFGNRLSPYPVSGGFVYPNESRALAAGGHHVIAKRTNGIVMAWGHNSFGQLGNGTTDTKPSPVVILNP
jgi:alpha-tubulin suppressor-like RCC1 family protein